MSPIDFGAFMRAALNRNHTLLEWHRAHQQPYTVEFAGQQLVIAPQVFCPTLGEGSQLLLECLPDARVDAALDLGTGSGALAIAAAEHARRVVATDISPLAVGCARHNVERLGLVDRVEVRQGDLFAPLQDGERFDLVLFNPPFLEGHPHDILEASVFDENYHILRRFFSGLRSHLRPAGYALIAFGDVGSIAYLNYLVHSSGLQATRAASRYFDPLEFFVIRLQP